MPIVEMDGQIPTGLNAFEQYQVYNCLDACITAQLLPEMWRHVNPNHMLIYEREMRLQSLCLDISSKGFPVDQLALMNLLKELDNEARWSLETLHLFCEAVYAPKLNPNSPLQVGAFFYDFLQLPVIWKFDHKTKSRKRGTDRDCLEKLRAMYPSAIPFVNAILAYREATKLSGVFRKGLEPNGKLRCNFSPSGTETGRLSSQSNVYGRGTNAQNLNDRVRRVVQAPLGYVLAYIDLKTAESIAVAFLSGDPAYIAASTGHDLHTTVAQLTWQDLGWTDDPKANRKIADRTFYREFSYRDMAKRGGHGTNYYGQPRTMAMHLKVQTALIEDFQRRYFRAFPGIPDWHLDVIARVQRDGVLVTPLGRERRFWGRSSDPATHREAIAFVPQSLVADIMNEGLMQVQRWILKEKLDVQLLAQVHDAGLFLLPARDTDSLIPEIQRRLEYPVDFGSLGIMRISADAQIGLNWGKQKDKNPAGLRDWRPGLELDFAA